ncbi:hypothetical protein [Hoylesella timonensis]|uniref:hypothetical protein n=1 Tax=Hoylesella timonensis TaxID=386414 RepID=UPI0002D66471|nr:hypothetical protein [Hoylesella timonensis]
MNANDLTERGKLVHFPYKTADAKVEIEITGKAINIQAGNVSVKIPRSSTQAVCNKGKGYNSEVELKENGDKV